jgi:hypothetical protein
MYKLNNIRLKNSTLDRKNLIDSLTPIKPKKILKEKDIFKDDNVNKKSKKTKKNKKNK